MALGYQNSFYLKQAQQKQQSLYNGKIRLEKHDPPVVYDSEETLQLAQESRLKMKQMNKEIKPANYAKINQLSGVFVSQKAKSREELYFSNASKMATVSKSISIPNEEFLDDTSPSVGQKFLNEEAAKFVREFKSLAKEADESLAKHKALEFEIKRLLRPVVSQDIMSIMQRVDNTAKTRRSQPMSNTKNDRNDKFEVVCAMCKQCLITANQDVCVLNYVNGMNSHGKKQKANVSNVVNQKKHKPPIRKPNKFCDSNLEVAFRRKTSFVRNLERVDMLKGKHTTNLYTINLLEMASVSPIFLMARATSTKSWLWHQCLSHLNFGTINNLAKNDLFIGLPKFKYHKEHLCPLCEQGKIKKASHPPKPVPNSKQKLHLLHMDLCGPMRVESINGKRYVLVIVDDYSRYTWVHFLRSKDESPEEIKTFLKKITVLL
ncbi:retrovirus-related pol polyprotein from transposon TNT 1-94 [Tanacetum coccineum]